MNKDSNYLTKLFSQNFSVSQPSYGELYQYDNLVKKIVDLYPDTAYSTGFEIESDDTDFYKASLDKLQIWEKFRLASKWGRLYGLACLLLISKGDLSEPLKSEIYDIKVYALDNQIINTNDDTVRIGDTFVHKSRLLYFTGYETMLTNNGEIGLKGHSVLDGCIDCLTSYRKLNGSLAKLLESSNQLIIGTSGLSAGIRNDIITDTNTQRDSIMSRLNSIQTGRSLSSIIL